MKTKSAIASVLAAALMLGGVSVAQAQQSAETSTGAMSSQDHMATGAMSSHDAMSSGAMSTGAMSSGAMSGHDAMSGDKHKSHGKAHANAKPGDHAGAMSTGAMSAPH